MARTQLPDGRSRPAGRRARGQAGCCGQTGQPAGQLGCGRVMRRERERHSQSASSGQGSHPGHRKSGLGHLQLHDRWNDLLRRGRLGAGTVGLPLGAAVPAGDGGRDCPVHHPDYLALRPIRSGIVWNAAIGGTGASSSGLEKVAVCGTGIRDAARCVTVGCRSQGAAGSSCCEEYL